MKGDCNSLGASPKKMLADITNLQHPCSKSSNQWDKHQNASFVPKDYLAVVKENAMLKKFMAEHQAGRMKIELEKLRRQNSDLARANHVLLTEINSYKDRLKELQHELGCKNGVVMAMKQQMEEKRNTVTSTFEVAASKKEEGTKRIACKTSKTINVDDKLCSSKRNKLFKPQTLLASDVRAHEEPEPSRKRGTKEQYKGYRSESIPAVLCGAAETEENEERSNAESRSSPVLFDECKTSKADTAEETQCVAKRRRDSKPLLYEPTASEQVDGEERIGNKRRMRRQSTLHKSISGSTATDTTFSKENEERCDTSVDIVDDKLCNVKKRRLSNPLPLMATSQRMTQLQEKVGNRRRSTRLSEGGKSESDPAVPSAFVSERIGERINGSNLSSQKCSASGDQEEDTEEIITAAKFESQESRPSIIGRPSRRAVEKVRSYKEISLKVKMRRPE